LQNNNVYKPLDIKNSMENKKLIDELKEVLYCCKDFMRVGNFQRYEIAIKEAMELNDGEMNERLFFYRNELRNKVRTRDRKTASLRNQTKCDECDNNFKEVHHDNYGKNRQIYLLCKRCHVLKHYPSKSKI